MPKRKEGAEKKIKELPVDKLIKEIADSGEFMKEPHSRTLAESRVEVSLREAGIPVIPKHHVGGFEFDMKVLGYAVLIEVDGEIHDMYSKRLKDLRKDRVASMRGFRVLRFANEEPVDVVVSDVRKVIASLPKVPREVWVSKYSWWSRIKDWIKTW